jgi:hypothetical protein
LYAWIVTEYALKKEENGSKMLALGRQEDGVPQDIERIVTDRIGRPDRWRQNVRWLQ